MRPFLGIFFGLAIVSSTTHWAKIGQTQDLACPMPDDGEKLQICSWRNGDEGTFKSSFKKSHGDRIGIKESNTSCMIRIERVEEKDEGIWGCKLRYQNKDGETIATEAKTILYVAKPDQTWNLHSNMPNDGEKLQVCSWRNGDEGAFKTSFKKSDSRITLSQTKKECRLHFLRVEAEDRGAWTCRIRYENSDGETILLSKNFSNDSYPALSTLYNNSRKPSSIDRLTTNNSTMDSKSLKQSGLDKLTSTNSTLDKKSQMHSSEDKLSFKNTTEAANNSISEKFNNGTVEKNGVADWVFGVLYILVSGFLEFNEKISENIPASEFAFSLGLSPSAAAGPSKSGEVGIAIGSNGDIIVYGTNCLGVKADLSLELDIVLGGWTSIKNIPGRNYAIGLGTDTANFQNEDGTDESGGNFEIVYNGDKVIGATFSLSYGYGYDLPIDYESNYDICETDVLMRLDGKSYYDGIIKKIATDM